MNATTVEVHSGGIRSAGWRSVFADSSLLTVGVAMFALAVPLFIAVFVDPTVINGSPRWLKPAKFAASTGLYALTLGWLLTHLRERPRLVRRVARVSAAVLVLEVVLISLQAARGTTSHFNGTSPLNAAINGVMGIGIVALWIASIVVAVRLVRQPFMDSALGSALRSGLVLTILGAAVGFHMVAPTSAQREVMKRGEAPLHQGAHSVGGPDGGAGMPVTGWSTEHGDLRVAHFLGLHAIQVLPLVAWALRRSRRSKTSARSFVRITAFGYFGLMLITWVQATRAQPLLRPDAWTVGSLLLLAGVCGVALLWSGRNAERPAGSAPLVA